MDLSNITPKWREIITSVDPDEFSHICENLKNETKRVFPPDPFAFAKFSAKNIRVVILGMDPYPKYGQAHGLAFSSCDSKTPASLNRIFHTLLNNKLLKDKPSHNRLDHLSMQGVLLLNTALTVIEGIPGSHIKLWNKWMTIFIDRLSELYPDAIWCLWGSHAQKFTPRGRILKWCHPVAMTSPSFSECDHFLKINEIHPVIWSCDETLTHLFTDGSCSGNNRKTNRIAGSGVVCTHGILLNNEYKEKVLQKMVDYEGILTLTEPSNIRAEGQAILMALRIVKQCTDIPFVIFTDSQFWIDIIFSYIPYWIDEEIQFNRKKNSDLIKEIWDVWQIINNRCKIEFVDSHHSKTPKRKDEPDYEYYQKGNRRAELCAMSANE